MGSTQGIIHGDIKSANILIGKNSEAKIAYYGLSKSHQANQVANDTNSSVGTNVYLDPEYEKTGKLNKESDIFFSFGVVLFEVLCRRLAYDPKYKEENDLTWTKRLKICIDVASGLEFLHGGTITLENVVHSNIRSSNILLTGDWKAKISNLELPAVHAYDQDMEHVINYANGTLGYLDPACKKGLTSQSDIYSFGVVLFEILWGRLAWQEGSEGNSQSLATLVMNRYEEGKLDEMVFKGIRKQAVTESLTTFQSIALQSSHDEKDKLPKASEVVKQLKKALEFQEDNDIWKPQLPSNYKEIIDMSKDLDQMYSINKNKDLYKKLTEGIFLEEEKVVISNMKKDFNKKKDLNKKKKLLEGEEPLHDGKVVISNVFRTGLDVEPVSLQHFIDTCNVSEYALTKCCQNHYPKILDTFKHNRTWT